MLRFSKHCYNIGVENKNKNYEFFKANLSKLTEKYLGKYVIIKDQKICDQIFNTFDSALSYAIQTKKFIPGNFIIQQCVSETENINTFVNHNVMF
jgi:hypothetical protein